MAKSRIQLLFILIVAITSLAYGEGWNPRYGFPIVNHYNDTTGLDDVAFWTSELGPDGKVYHGRSHLWTFSSGSWEKVIPNDFQMIRDLLFDSKGNLWILSIHNIGYIRANDEGELSDEYVDKTEEFFADIEIREEFWSFMLHEETFLVGGSMNLYRVKSSGTSIFSSGQEARGRNYFIPTELGMVTLLKDDALYLITNNAKRRLFESAGISPKNIAGVSRLGNGFLFIESARIFYVDDSMSQIIWAKELDFDKPYPYLYTYARVINESIVAIGTFGNGVYLFDLGGDLLLNLNETNGLGDSFVYWLEVLHDRDLLVSTTKSVATVSLNQAAGIIDERHGINVATAEKATVEDDSILLDTFEGSYRIKIGEDDIRIDSQYVFTGEVEQIGDHIVMASPWQLKYVEKDTGLEQDLEVDYENFIFTRLAASSKPNEIGVLFDDYKFSVFQLSESGKLESVSPVFQLPIIAEFLISDTDGGFFAGNSDSGLIHINEDSSDYKLEIISEISGTLLSGLEKKAVKSRDRVCFSLGKEFAAYDPIKGIFNVLPDSKIEGTLNAFGLSENAKQTSLYAVVFSEEFKTQVLMKYDLGKSTGWEILPFADLNSVGSVDLISPLGKKNQKILLAGKSGNLILNPDLIEDPFELKAPSIRPGKLFTDPANSKGVPFVNSGLTIAYSSDRTLERFPLGYETRLIGAANDQWSELNARSRRELGQLFEGKYIFEVRSKDPFGRYSPISSFEFSILPPWYRSYYAYGSYALIIVVSIFSFIRLREKRLQKEKTILETTVAERTAELLRANRFKDEFIANMSHEIRNPLNGVIGLIRRLSPNQPTPSRYLSALQNAASYLQTTVEEILDFSKIESGEITVENHIFDLESVVDIVMDIYSQKASRKGIPIYKAISLKPGMKIVSDSAKIQQIFGNLLGNAVKFTDRGSITVGVSVKEHDNGKGFLKLWVTDSGVGIHPSEIDRVFEKFYQTDEGKEQQSSGTGLGLALCRRFAEALGGGISVESVQGEGSTFTASLPVEIEYQLLPEVKQTNENLIPLNVLLVEDLEYNRLFIEDLLAERRCNVTTACDGLEGLKKVKGNSFDLLITDWDLPELTGLELVRIIRRDNLVGKDVLILGMTAFATDETRKTCLESGMDDFITKPLRVEQLDEVLIKVRAIKAKPEANKEEKKQNIIEAQASEVGEFEGKLIDGLGLLKRMKGTYSEEGGDESNRYLRFYHEYRLELTKAMEGLDSEEIRSAAHRFLGHLRMIEAPYPSGVISDLLTSAQAGDIDSCRLEYEVFEGIEDDLLNEIRELFKSKPYSND